ncbi:MAG: sulfotransferase family 2 domain-containing protein [Chloroflexi bacterium]|nr:sulfotransferase family 2 domain-containing protein [Chloroflexota bacterium]
MLARASPRRRQALRTTPFIARPTTPRSEIIWTVEHDTLAHLTRGELQPLPAPVLLFVHLPRTAGTTFNGILSREYGADALYKVHDGLAIEHGFVTAGDDPFVRLTAERRQRYAAISGHMSVGLHSWVPGPSRYVTILRDPVERVASLYQFIAEQPSHRLHERITRDGWTLADCLTHPDYPMLQFNNGQLRMLTGAVTADRLPRGVYDSERLARAVHLVDETLDLVGTTDRFDEFLVLAWRRYGWQMPLYRASNVSAAPKKAILDPSTVALIETYNRMDRELYAYARRRLDQATAAAGTAFTRDLAAFRLLNHAGGRT